METRRLPIGISDYKKMIDEGYYYVDKTDFIRQIIEEGALITLLPRPRRFGKTLNLSMLRYFFEKTDGNVFRPLFDGKTSPLRTKRQYYPRFDNPNFVYGKIFNQQV